ncbi:MAG: major tail protein [Bacteriophage sp.]|nr:MAG: major tail protein [Bacteriophage sp.]
MKGSNMDFPHLQNATAFPDTDTRVYGQYRNVFDYNVWTPNTVIKLCRVNWYDDYHDVVKFPDDAARNEWFDKLDGETVKLTTNMYIARADTDGIKLPLPYMTAQQYNYIVVDFSRDIINTPYQKTDAQTRYHFFITSVRAEAPNTTTCTLTRDVWTDYINSTTINGMVLTRGHAPLMETTPAQLLENPRANCRDFTLSDVDFGNAASNVRKSTPFNLQNGTRYICLATTFTPEQLQIMSGMRGTNITDSEPTYSNNDAVVTSFSWGAGNIYTANVTGAGTSYNSVDNLTASNVSVYALESSKISGDYFDTLFAYYPHIMSQVTAVFVATANMIRFGNVVSVNGVEWRTISGNRAKISDIDLTINDFGYATEYAKITRLYLAPYAHLEISDNIGNKTRVEIADCGRLSVQTVTSLSYPILRQIAWLDGIGSDGDTSVTIDAIDGTSITANVPNADVLKTLISHDIPTYALQRRAIDAHRADAYNLEIAQARENAIISYENGARSANVALSNTNRSNANSIANTNLTNALNSTVTANSNNASNAIYKNNVTQQNLLLSASNNKIDEMNTASLDLTTQLVNTEITASAIGTVTAAIGTIGTAATGIAVTAATGGAAAPMVAAGLGAAGSIGLSGASFATGASKTSTEAAYKQAYNDAAAFAAKKYNGQANSVSIAMAGTQNIQATTLNTSNTNASNTTNSNVAANNANTSNANASASRNQSVDNAKRVMVNTRSNVNAAWRDLLNQAAQPVGAYGGDNFRQATGLDTMTVKIVTEDNGAIAAAGDYMLRYGIASNKLYNKPSLTPCKHFTYWQTADIWTLCPLAQNDQLQTIKNIFSSGVTIWTKPEEVGGDFVYDNL